MRYRISLVNMSIRIERYSKFILARNENTFADSNVENFVFVVEFSFELTTVFVYFSVHTLLLKFI